MNTAHDTSGPVPPAPFPDDTRSDVRLFRDVFRRGSRTYFYSSVFFPRDMRADVSCLYAFVRTADDFVDTLPQDKSGFRNFRASYAAAAAGVSAGDPIIDPFVSLVRRREFDPSWVEAFLDAMESDLYQARYSTVSPLLQYMYGSAEVIGLMMSRILGLDRRGDGAARMLGRSMQYINFIRDIEEDLRLGRTYLPADEIADCGLVSLDETYTRRRPVDFARFVQRQVARYEKWQVEAEKGFGYIPRRYLIPIKTASEMYKWTARRIAKDPYLVYGKKVKPRVARILVNAGYHAVTLPS